MPDEQQLGSRPRMLGNEMTSPVERGAVDPTRGEAERIELGAQHVGDATHTGEVHRAAVDVDDALQ